MYAGWAGELLATERDYWGAEQLRVKLEPGGFELDPIRLVASGANEIGVAGADQILLARERGIPLVAFAVQYQEAPVGFVVKRGSGIRSIADFAGRKVGVKLGTDIEPIYRAALARVGVAPGRVTEVPVRFDLAPFYQGVVDVYPGYLTSDLLLPEEQGVAVNTLRASDVGVRGYGNVYFCTEDFLRRNPEVPARFLRAVRRGWTDALAMPHDSIARIALKYNPSLKADHEARVAASIRPYVATSTQPFGTMTDSAWHSLYRLLREQGVLKTDFDPKAAYTMDVLRRAGPPPS